MNASLFTCFGQRQFHPRPRRQLWRVRLHVEQLETRNLLSFGGTPYAVGPTVTPTTTEPEAEEHIAVDPNDFHNLLIGVTDNGIVRLGRHFATAKYAFASDNGATWTERYVPIDPVSERLPTADGRSWTNTQDPVVAIDRAGNAYLANLYLNFDPVASAIHENGVYVGVTSIKSLGKLATQAGSGFTAAHTFPVVVNADPNTPFFEDKEWIAVDNSTSAFGGNVYVSWAHLAGVPGDQFKGNEQILFSRSSDHGETWSAPIEITSLKNWQGGIQGSQVAVGPTGEVYVVYADHFFDGSAQLFLSRSADGGVTFSEPVAITANFHTLSFASTYPKNSWPSLAVSPTSGDVYVVYADQPNKKVGAEVELIRSTDGGATFSAPAAINDMPVGQQFMPAVTVDEAGVVHASWFDTRNSPSDSSAYDIYATFSTDGGATFRPNARVTPNSINVGASGFIGDYAGIAAGGGFAHPVWSTGRYDTRTGGLRTATLTDDPPGMIVRGISAVPARFSTWDGALGAATPDGRGDDFATIFKSPAPALTASVLAALRAAPGPASSVWPGPGDISLKGPTTVSAGARDVQPLPPRGEAASLDQVFTMIGWEEGERSLSLFRPSVKPLDWAPDWLAGDMLPDTVLPNSAFAG